MLLPAAKNCKGSVTVNKGRCVSHRPYELHIFFVNLVCRAFVEGVLYPGVAEPIALALYRGAYL